MCWVSPILPFSPVHSLSPLYSVPEEGGPLWMASGRLSCPLASLLSAKVRQWWKAYSRSWKGRKRQMFGSLFPKLPPVGLEPGSNWVPLPTANGPVGMQNAFLQQQHSPGSLNHSTIPSVCPYSSSYPVQMLVNSLAITLFSGTTFECPICFSQNPD